MGVDCGSLLYMLFTEAGLVMKPFPDDYPQDWCLHRDDERYLNFLEPYTRPTATPQVGGIAVFRFGGAYSHGCLITETGRLIHAYGRTGDGEVMESPWKFFTHAGGKPRLVKFFEVNL